MGREDSQSVTMQDCQARVRISRRRSTTNALDTHLQPRLDARMGPIVEPHGMSLRTLNSWHEMPRRCPT